MKQHEIKGGSQTAARHGVKRAGVAAAKPRDKSAENIIDRAVGRRVRQARLERGMSQADLGKVVGVSFQQMQKYERGTNRISASRLVMIGQALGVDPRCLLPDGYGPAPEDTAPLSRRAILLARLYDAIPSEDIRESMLALARAASLL